MNTTLTDEQRELLRAVWRERMRKYRAEHPDKAREYGRRYYEKNREKINARHREWQRKNPDKVRAMKIRYDLKKAYARLAAERESAPAEE